MSMMGPQALGKRGNRVGETVASYPDYEAAQKAVSTLIAAEVPAREISIVGQGLRSIERVTGRLGFAAAARTGSVNGILIGLFFSAILMIGSPDFPIQAFAGILFVGVAIGMLLSLISLALVRRRRDFASVMQVVADHYEVAVDGASAAKARQALGAATTVAASAAPAAPVVVPADAPPPRYGERLPVNPPVSTPTPPSTPPVGTPGAEPGIPPVPPLPAPGEGPAAEGASQPHVDGGDPRP